MAEQRSDEPGDPVILAIERVLGAEQAAKANLQESRQQAEGLIAAARAHAAAIARRAEARIARLHTAYLQKIDADIAKLQAPEPSAGETADILHRESALLQAANRLAAMLTGGT
jgi:hypothetical protein